MKKLSFKSVIINSFLFIAIIFLSIGCEKDEVEITDINGNWIGTTSQNEDISFKISNNVLTEIKIKIISTGLTGEFTYSPTNCTITDNSFSLSIPYSTTIDITGKFESNNSSKGTFSFGTSGTWTATKQNLQVSEESAILFNSLLNYGTMTDQDGNTYNTIEIGTQTWMAENLRATKYIDGTSIPNITNDDAWVELETGAYCWYNNSYDTYGNIYGALYNWYAVNSGKLAPTGWHIPSYDEWDTLIEYLGGQWVAGNKLKEFGTTHWIETNENVTNESGFTALPGGSRNNGGMFVAIHESSCLWSSTEKDSSIAWYQYINHIGNGSVWNEKDKSKGLSIRCIKD